MGVTANYYLNHRVEFNHGKNSFMHRHQQSLKSIQIAEIFSSLSMCKCQNVSLTFLNNEGNGAQQNAHRQIPPHIEILLQRISVRSLETLTRYLNTNSKQHLITKTTLKHWIGIVDSNIVDIQGIYYLKSCGNPALDPVRKLVLDTQAIKRNFTKAELKAISFKNN